MCENAVLKEQIRRLDERIAYLERLLYGSKSDRMSSRIPDNQPGLFDCAIHLGNSIDTPIGVILAQ